jgi:hypothetical protein
LKFYNFTPILLNLPEGYPNTIKGMFQMCGIYIFGNNSKVCIVLWNYSFDLYTNATWHCVAPWTSFTNSRSNTTKTSSNCSTAGKTLSTIQIIASTTKQTCVSILAYQTLIYWCTWRTLHTLQKVPRLT